MRHSTSIRGSVCRSVGWLVGWLVGWSVGHARVDNHRKCMKIPWKLILFIIHVTRSFIHSFIHSLSYFSTVRSNRARDRCRTSCFWSFHSLSYSSTVSWIELGVGLIELGIDLRINNARRTVLARVSGLVHVPFASIQPILIGKSIWT